MKLKTDLRVDNKKSWKGSYRGFLGLISFSTILPLNIHTSIQEWQSSPGYGQLLVVSLNTCGPVRLCYNGSNHHPQLVAAAIIYSFAIWFTGFHHLDGLVDFGDAVMAHGHPEKRIQIMRDTRIGTGGLAYSLSLEF